MVKHLTENDNFKDLIKAENILVDFYAEWCGPCKMLAPILEKIDFVNVIKVNVDEFRDLAIEYGVMSIPTLIAFKNGEIADTKIGLQDINEIKEMFEN